MRSPIRSCSVVSTVALACALIWHAPAAAGFPPVDAQPVQPPSAAPASAPTVAPAPPPDATPQSAPATEAKPADASSAQMHLELSVFGRVTPNLDLADMARASGHGASNDAATNLGLQLSVGVEYAPFEFGVDLARSAGGLDGSKIDSRYFDSRDPAASAVTEDGGLRLWWVHATSPDFQVMAGPHFRWMIHLSESSVSQTQLNVFGVGAQAGFRWRTNAFSDLVDGSLRVLASAHGNSATSLSVRRASGDLLFASSEPDGIFFDYSVSLGYGVTFR